MWTQGAENSESYPQDPGKSQNSGLLTLIDQIRYKEWAPPTVHTELESPPILSQLSKWQSTPEINTLGGGSNKEVKRTKGRNKGEKRF